MFRFASRKAPTSCRRGHASRPAPRYRLVLEALEDRCCPTLVTGMNPTPIPDTNVNTGNTVTITATTHSSDANENGEGDEFLTIQAGTAVFIVRNFEETQLFQFQATSNSPAITAFFQDSDDDESADVTVQVTPGVLAPNTVTSLQAVGQQLIVAAVAFRAMCTPAPPQTVWGVTPILEADTDLAAESFLNLANWTPDTTNDQQVPQPITINANAFRIDTSQGVTTAEVNPMNDLLQSEKNLFVLNTQILTAINRGLGANQLNNATAAAAQQQALQQFLAQLPNQLSLLANHLTAAEQVLEAHCTNMNVMPPDIQAIQANVQANGLDPATVAALRQAGATQATINAIQQQVVVQDQNAVATAAATPLTNTALTGAVQQGIQTLRGGEAVSELGAYRASDGSWSLDSDGTLGFNGATDQVFYNFSPPGVIGVAGDWNGSGTTNIGDFSNGTWHLDLAGTGAPPGANETFQFGQAGDQPVVGDWDGNPSGRDEIGVFRTAPDGITGEFILDIANHKTMDSSNLVFTFGYGTDHIIVGDWTGSGTTEVGVYRDAASYIAADAGDIVFSINSNGDHATFTNFVFGLITDKVVIGDWNGSGTSKVGTYRDGTSFNAPGTALFSLDTNGSLMYQPGVSEVFLYGLDSDQFVTGHWAKTPPLQPEGTPGTGGSPSPSPTANPFAGTYAGTFSGSGTAFGFTEPVSSGVNGTIDSNGNIAVTNPGSGSGSVSATGVAHITGTGTIDVANADYTFDGTFVQASDGTITGSGSWSATFSGGSASGTWQVSRQ